MSSDDIKKFISILTESVKPATPGKIPAIMSSADGGLLFAVDSQETFDIIEELERMGLGEADQWGGMEFNPELSQEWQAKFAKIKLVKAENANKAWAKYEKKMASGGDDEGYENEDDVMIEYAEKLLSILTKYAVEYYDDSEDDY